MKWVRINKRATLLKDLTDIYKFDMMLPMFDTYLFSEIIKQFLRQNSYITLHTRPKCSEEIHTFSDESTYSENVCIVLQGPILKTDDFTLNTIKLYKKIFSNTKIILSTWDNEDKVYLKKLKNENIKIVLNKLPAQSGVANINYQICSTQNGIKYAKSTGAQFVIKNRTDQRMYSPNVVQFLLNLYHQFPSKKKYAQHGRILGVSLDTFKYRLYSLTDMLLFGHVDDMLLYFSPPLDTRTVYQPPLNLLEASKQNYCEIYLATHFLLKIGFNIEWSLKQSWKAFAECFLVFDTESIDLYWPKYGHLSEYRYRTYKSLTNKQLMDFKEWLNIHCKYSSLYIPEETLNYDFDHDVMIKK